MYAELRQPDVAAVGLSSGGGDDDWDDFVYVEYLLYGIWKYIILISRTTFGIRIVSSAIIDILAALVDENDIVM